MIAWRALWAGWVEGVGGKRGTEAVSRLDL